MKQFFLLILLTNASFLAQAQKVDSIFFHLYTDSLKKGTHNYINVDGKLSDKSWKPLTQKEIRFTSSYGEMEGNDLVLPDHPTVEKVTIRAELRANPQIVKECVIWIKKRPDSERLPTAEEVMKSDSTRGKKKNKN